MKADKNVFPYKLCNSNGDATIYTGLRVRDYIAIQAMAGLLANTRVVPMTPLADVAKDCYKIADAMLKQSEVPHE